MWIQKRMCQCAKRKIFLWKSFLKEQTNFNATAFNEKFLHFLHKKLGTFLQKLSCISLEKLLKMDILLKLPNESAQDLLRTFICFQKLASRKNLASQKDWSIRKYFTPLWNTAMQKWMEIYLVKYSLHMRSNHCEPQSNQNCKGGIQLCLWDVITKRNHRKLKWRHFLLLLWKNCIFLSADKYYLTNLRN